MIMKNPQGKYILLAGLLCGFFIRSFSQDLVANSGFEIYEKCPGDFSQASSEFKVDQWQSASAGTPDYFNSCSVGNADVPHNWAGVSDAYAGQAYTGIYSWMNND